jgi:hypothetical protein
MYRRSTIRRAIEEIELVPADVRQMQQTLSATQGIGMQDSA